MPGDSGQGLQNGGAGKPNAPNTQGNGELENVRAGRIVQEAGDTRIEPKLSRSSETSLAGAGIAEAAVSS